MVTLGSNINTYSLLLTKPCNPNLTRKQLISRYVPGFNLSTCPSDCKINIIAPPANFKVGRTTKKFEILNSGYNMGIDTAKAFLAK
ncbi:MAG: DUF6363 domain-containing protein [Enterobacterales bacterium]